MRDWLPSLDRFDALIGGCGAMIVAAVGGWTEAMTVLVWLMGLDFVAGVLRAAVQGQISSNVMWRKTATKVALISIVIILSSRLGCLFSQGEAVRDAAVMFFAVAQGTSVLENLLPVADSVGLGIPPILKDVLEQLGKDKRVQK